MSTQLSDDKAKKILMEELEKEYGGAGKWMFNARSYDAVIRAMIRFAELSNEPVVPKEIQEAENYISKCESDIGFMGSPEYYDKKKMVDDYFKNKQPEPLTISQQLKEIWK